MPSNLFDLKLTPFDVVKLRSNHLREEPMAEPDDAPTDEEIADAIMREMDIQQLSRDEVLRTVREFFKGKTQKAVN